jgi:hypothetical protein
MTMMKLFRFAIALGLYAGVAVAQPPGPGLQGPATGQAAAPHDITGYWVAVVTEDWRYRMITAKAGDYPGINLTPAAQLVANAWDPAKDIAAGNVCKAYGAGGLLRLPTRLHITWASDNVLSIETDAGKQKRLFKFGAAQDGAGAGTLQGVSKARWDLQRERAFGPVVNGTLEVVTTQMAPGYVRKNGVPYGEGAKLTEYYETVKEDNGEQFLIVIANLEDAANLAQPVLTSTNFKREPDGKKWDPSECTAK